MTTLKKQILKDIQIAVISEELGSNTPCAFMTHCFKFFYASLMLDFKEINLFTATVFIWPENKMSFFKSVVEAY